MGRHTGLKRDETCTVRGCRRCEDIWFDRRGSFETSSAFGFTEINLFGVGLYRRPPGHPRGGKCDWCHQEAPIELISRTVTVYISGCHFRRSALTCALHFTQAIDYIHGFYFPEWREEVRSFYTKHYRLARAA